MKDKKNLRKRIQDKLSTITKQDYEHYSYMIAKKLYEETLWQEATTIGITVSKMPEVDTYQIIRKAWDEGKKVVIPKCSPKNKTMEFRTLTAFNQLESVYYGLLEPKPGMTEGVTPDEIDLLIVPGLAYTRRRFRLGFGGGYYDRFLKMYNGRTISLAFHMQLVEDIPVEEHDLPVEKIITDRESI